MKEEIKMVDLPEPIGDFILAQKDIIGVELYDGTYYHYSKVCVLLGRLKASLAASQPIADAVDEKDKEIKMLHDIIDMKEEQRARWADLCIKKQRIIDGLASTPIADDEYQYLSIPDGNHLWLPCTKEEYGMTDEKYRRIVKKSTPIAEVKANDEK